jgi:hypothetical protein
MQQHQRHRLPVVARNWRIVGMLSLSDVVREAEKGEWEGTRRGKSSTRDRRDTWSNLLASRQGSARSVRPCRSAPTARFVVRTPLRLADPSGRRQATRETASPTRANRHRIEYR